MKIIITGNMGYVGPAVVGQLRSAYPKSTIVGLDMGFFSHCLTNARVLPETQVDFQIFGDVREISPKVLDGTATVVYLAAISNDVMGEINEQLTLAINCDAAVRMARSAKRAGARSFVYASSCSVYGFAEDGARSEKSSLSPLTAYARSKALAEAGLKPIADRDFVVTCLRFPTACGMSDRLRLDLVLNDFVAGALASRQVSVLSDGTPWRPLIHIDDMARAIEWATGRRASHGSPFLVINAGSDQWNYQIRDLAEVVAREMPGVSVSINRNGAPDRRSYRVAFDLFKSLAPHHQPAKSLEETIGQLKEGLEQMYFGDVNFRQSNWIRLNVLKGLWADGLLDPNLRWKRTPTNGERLGRSSATQRSGQPLPLKARRRTTVRVSTQTQAASTA
jgi:nucleoside-diphosphate-sugar epimerase